MGRNPNSPEVQAFARCLGVSMRVVRKRAGLKNTVVSQDIGVTEQAISAWETGKVVPTLSSLLAFCNRCNVSTWEVIRSAERTRWMQQTMTADRARQHAASRETEDQEDSEK